MLTYTRSLENSEHAAYDIHRTKALLLKLDDPRIAAVRDEDEDLCFISDDDNVLLDAQRHEHKRRQWEEQMRACEYVWDVAKRRMRKERLWLQRRRDLEERRRAADDVERQRVFREREAVVQQEKAVAKARLHRNVVSYDALVRAIPSPPSLEDPLVYDAMANPFPSFPAWNRRRRLSTPSSSPLVRSHSTRSDDIRSVSFKDVLASVEGLLFPLTAEELQLFGKNHQRQAELLDELLGQNGEKGKVKEAEVRSPIPLARKRRTGDLPWLSPSPSSSISTCPSLTRSSSWLSYISRSSETYSPTPSPLPQVILPNWLKPSYPAVCRICQKQSKRLSVALSDSPLHCAAAEVKPSHNSGNNKARRVGRKRQSIAGATSVVMNGLTHLVDAAKQLQRAYMMAAVYHVVELDRTGEDDDRVGRGLWRPAGTRARSKDVKIFLGVIEPTHDTTPVQYIPLVSPFPPAYPPRTELPNPLPYPIVFKPHPPIRRSPFRLLDKESRSTLNRLQKLKSVTGESRVYDGTNLRFRLVGNPAYLRLKALQNVLYERGYIWEGHGNDCGFSSGKETLHGVAFEGIGPSLLSVF